MSTFCFMSSNSTSVQYISQVIRNLSLFLWLCVPSLLILTVLNLGLFFKLWAMEDVANRMYLSTKHHLRERTESSFAADFFPEPAPTYRTREETLLLKAVLQDSIKLLEQLRSSLSLLQQKFVTNRTAILQ